jgi:threonine synthase
LRRLVQRVSVRCADDQNVEVSGRKTRLSGIAGGLGPKNVGALDPLQPGECFTNNLPGAEGAQEQFGERGRHNGGGAAVSISRNILCAMRKYTQAAGSYEAVGSEVERSPDLAEMGLGCAACGHRHRLEELAWRCAACGGVLDLAGFTPVIPPASVLSGRPPTLWRYAGALPVAEPPDISLGEGLTPLVAAPGLPGVLLKMDYLMPTGSFKDRGAVVLTALARQLAVPRMIADSSGNAGTAVAAYAARAGIPCEVYVPAATSAAKVAQLRAYGATVQRVSGSREDTAAAAMQAAGQPGTFYASHVYHPFFLHGTKTYVLELWEQLGGRLPAVLVLPVGNGTLVLGAYLACCELLRQGLMSEVPRIAAVQAESCAPLADAFKRGLAAPEAIEGKETVAEGIAIARPARGAQILAAVRETSGTIVTVSDDQVRAAHIELARAGLYVEPTAAVCWAALRAGLIETGPVLNDRPRAVAPLCGSGLKSKPPST